MVGEKILLSLRKRKGKPLKERIRDRYKYTTICMIQSVIVKGGLRIKILKIWIIKGGYAIKDTTELKGGFTIKDTTIKIHSEWYNEYSLWVSKSNR